MLCKAIQGILRGRAKLCGERTQRWLVSGVVGLQQAMTMSKAPKLAMVLAAAVSSAPGIAADVPKRPARAADKVRSSHLRCGRAAAPTPMLEAVLENPLRSNA